MSSISLTAEQKAMIERKRLAALERRRLHQLKLQQQHQKQSQNESRFIRSNVNYLSQQFRPYRKRKRCYDEMQMQHSSSSFPLQRISNSYLSTQNDHNIQSNPLHISPQRKRRRLQYNNKHVHDLDVENSNNYNMRISTNTELKETEMENVKNDTSKDCHSESNLISTKQHKSGLKSKSQQSNNNLITNYLLQTASKKKANFIDLTLETSTNNVNIKKERKQQKKKKKRHKTSKKAKKQKKQKSDHDVESKPKSKYNARNYDQKRNNGAWIPINKATLFERLSHSKFRSKFKLGSKEINIVETKRDKLEDHAFDFVHKRLSAAYPTNDGKQTPMRGHPVFIAQHATATCCRTCLSKWHFIPMGVALTNQQIDYMVDVILHWISLKCPISKETNNGY